MSIWLLAFALIKDAVAAESAQVEAHISYANDPYVCSSPNVFGPYTLSGAIGSAITSNATDVTPDQGSVDIMNAGSFAVCILTTPPITAYVTVSDVVVDVE